MARATLGLVPQHLVGLIERMEPLRTPSIPRDLFPALHAELIALLRGLDDNDWTRQTIAPAWRVRDVAAHLLDGDLRKLSGGRDRQALASRPLTSFGDIVALINEANASGVAYAVRLSPRVMTIPRGDRALGVGLRGVAAAARPGAHFGRVGG